MWVVCVSMQVTVLITVTHDASMLQAVKTYALFPSTLVPFILFVCSIQVTLIGIVFYPVKRNYYFYTLSFRTGCYLNKELVLLMI